MIASTTVHNLMDQIRDVVNESHVYYELSQNNDLFSQLVSALDTIADTEEAIAAFSTDEVSESTGALYLAIYGLLQAFFIQQDAATNLCHALGIQDNSANYPVLQAIREIRNDSVGHPTKRDRVKGQPNSYHQIVRQSMSKQGFQLLSYSNNTQKVSDISIPTRVTDQKTFICDMLTHILEELGAKHESHKEKFRMNKLVDIFPKTLGYALEKVEQGLYDEQSTQEQWGIEHLKTIVRSFFDAVSLRDKGLAESLKNDYKYIDHAVTRMEQIITAHKQQMSAPTDELDRHIYLSFLRQQIEELRSCAMEIDIKYNT